jgi:hypothetical protein
MAGARAGVGALYSLRKKEMQVKSLQEYGKLIEK